eukprot:Colp12_sorted_trinity150504_noHs@21752
MAAVQDPFYTVKQDVIAALTNAKNVYIRWQEQQSSGSGSESRTAEELKQIIKAIEWDLDDLTETVTIVEGNQAKFKIDTAELQSRKQFITNTRRNLKDMRDHLASAKGKAASQTRSSLLGSSRGGGGYTSKYQKLENEIDHEIEDENSRFLDRETRKQEMIMEDQDRKLGEVEIVISSLKSRGEAIRDELERQDFLIDDVTGHVGKTDGRLRQMLTRVDRVLNASSDTKQTCAIVFLLIILIILIVIYFAT